MISLKQQIPVKSTVQTGTDLQRSKAAGHLYAIMRRLGERITDLERRTGENSRDIGRIEQKIRRENLKLPSLEEKPNQPASLAGLFGITEG